MNFLGLSFFNTKPYPQPERPAPFRSSDWDRLRDLESAGWPKPRYKLVEFRRSRIGRTPCPGVWVDEHALAPGEQHQGNDGTLTIAAKRGHYIVKPIPSGFGSYVDGLEPLAPVTYRLRECYASDNDNEGYGINYTATVPVGPPPVRDFEDVAAEQEAARQRLRAMPEDERQTYYAKAQSRYRSAWQMFSQEGREACAIVELTGETQS